MVVAYGTCVGSWDKFNRWVVRGVGEGRPLMGLAGQHSITGAYNKIIDAHRGRGYDALVLLHDDLELLTPIGDAEQIIRDAFQDKSVGLVGVAGSDFASMYWWNGRTLGWQRTDSGVLDFGERWGDAVMLEGSFLVLSPVMIENLRFDQGYTGFLGYDDVCLTVRMMGFKSVVVGIDTHHHSTVGFKSRAVREDWERSERRFNEKWRSR